MRYCRLTIWRWILVLLLSSPATAAIQLDFSPDQQTDNFFQRHPLAQAAIEKAAEDLSGFLVSPLASIAPDELSTISATVGQSNINFRWTLLYTNPSTDQTQSWDASALGFGDLRVFVGMRPLADSLLGLGSTMGFSVSVDGGGFTDELEAAFQQALAQSNRVMTRGEAGPVTGRVALADVAGTGEEFEGQVGSFGGSLSMDIDTDNDGRVDTDQQLESFWHFDPTTPVPIGKFDFYSVALHELLHTVGLGSAAAWDELVVGNDWLGPNVNALTGNQAGILSDDRSHVIQDLFSETVANGTRQPAAIAPAVVDGRRLQLTHIDLAFLEDIGWDIAREAEPTSTGDFNQDGQLDGLDLALLDTADPQQIDRYDLNDDAIVDSLDRDIWVHDLKMTWYGDANFDGEFNTSDLVTVFQSGEYEDAITGNSVWHTGDWNGDGEFNSGDVIQAFQDGGFEQGQRTTLNPVPEPAGWCVVASCAMAFANRRRTYLSPKPSR